MTIFLAKGGENEVILGDIRMNLGLNEGKLPDFDEYLAEIPRIRPHLGLNNLDFSKN